MISFKFPVVRRLSWQQIRDLIRFMGRRLDEEHLPQVAGSLTFTTVLALVPVLTIALAIFTTFPLFNTFRASLEEYFIQSLMPATVANTILGYLNQFAMQAKRLSAVGGVLLIGTAITMIAMIDRTLNQIWRVRKARAFTHRILLYWSIVTLGPLLIGVSITITSYLFAATDDAVRVMPMLGSVFYTLVSVFLTTLAFTLLYLLVPNRAIDWRDAASGGLLAGIAFEVSKRLFAVFVAKFPTYTVVYGALAAMPIFLLWIYMGWLITLLGAVLAAALPVVRYERWWHVSAPGSAFLDAMAVLGVLFVARANGETAAVDAFAIRRSTRLGLEESESLLQKMLEARWVGRVNPDRPTKRKFGGRRMAGHDRWILLANPAQLRLSDVYRLFVFDVSADTVLTRQVENAVEQGLEQSLESYFRDGGLAEGQKKPEAGPSC
jgi:membrane protein